MTADATRRRFDAPLSAWFASRGWKPAAFQRETWRRYRRGESGLLVSPTGSGKTLAALGGVLLDACHDNKATAGKRNDKTTPRTRLLWITPLRALANDTLRALREPVDALGLDWTLALRTGDASARDKRLARQGRADALVITPESLALLLSYPETSEQLSGLQAILVDEWHELLGNKRGVLLQLCLARLRKWSPQVRIWGMSATLGNLTEARDVLLPHVPDATIVHAGSPRSLTIHTLLPEHGERFPWAGHLGLSQMQRVSEQLNQARSTLLFANTRSQAELWHRALSAIWLDDPSSLALHHGSLDTKLRAQVEQGLRDGTVRCAVATSSLDLGVDFPTVDQVIQIGSPKGMARLLHRAGRARHRPGEAGRVICVPTHALELAEYAAVREALAAGEIEARPPPILSVDVLAQHCVTLALGGGFDPRQLKDEVKGTHAFADMSDALWQAVLDYIVRGGAALENYPEYRRVVVDQAGIYRVSDRRIAFRHRLSIGTISSDGALQVKLLRGGSLGSVEESFLARLRARDRFQFAGRTLELVRLEGMTAYVRVVKQADGIVPRWQGSRMSLSTALGARVARVLADPPQSPEMQALAPLLTLQAEASALPAPERLLVEWTRTREGWHLFVFPFAGRWLHEGLAALLALRWSRQAPNTFAFGVNDYGLVLTAKAETDVSSDQIHELLDPHGLEQDLREGANLGELARRQFRDIARVAGLLPPWLPGRQARSLRQLQASSGLLFDVLRTHDPGHMLLQQAEREVFEQTLDIAALRRLLARCHALEVDLQRPRHLTPLSFPLWAETVRGTLSSEDWQTRVRRAAQQLERRHG